MKRKFQAISIMLAAFGFLVAYSSPFNAADGTCACATMGDLPPQVIKTDCANGTSPKMNIEGAQCSCSCN